MLAIPRRSRELPGDPIETVYYSDDDSRTDILPTKEYVNGVVGRGSPSPSPVPIPPIPCTPQLTNPITIAQALYLLATGKLVQVPSILLCALLEELFNHFKEELVADQDWARTPAGIDYAYYGYGYILNEEVVHFACQAYNMIHPDHLVQIPDCYQCPEINLPPMMYTPEPMTDKPPILPQWATIPDYTSAVLSYAYAMPSHAYPRGYRPPGTQGPSRLFAAAITGNEAGPSDQPQLLNKPQPPSRLPQPPAVPVAPPRWAPPCYPLPPKPPDPPIPWVLATDNEGPWAALKPNMVKEPKNFNGDSNNIARFFSQCDMYFLVFNQYFRHHPHKVIFCTSHFSKDTQVWWELCA